MRGFSQIFFSASDHLSGFYVCAIIFGLKNMLILTIKHTGASQVVLW